LISLFFILHTRSSSSTGSNNSGGSRYNLVDDSIAEDSSQNGDMKCKLNKRKSNYWISDDLYIYIRCFLIGANFPFFRIFYKKMKALFY